MPVVVNVVKALGVYFVKKMLLGLALDLVEEAMEKGAAKTEYKWDDKLAEEFKKNRKDIENLVKGVV